MKRSLTALLGAALLLAFAPAPTFAAGTTSQFFHSKSPLRYFPCTYTFSTTASVTAAQVCVLPPGGAILRDVVVYQNAAGTGGTSWTAAPKRATVALTSTNGGFTLAAGASKVTNAALSKMGALTNPTGGTRPVLSGDVAATGTVTITAGISAGQTVTVQGVVFTAAASGATGNQFNVGADQNAAATNLAAAINASASNAVKGSVTATAATNVVTITARQPGTNGNALTLAVSGANLSASGSTLAGGFNAWSSGGELVTVDITLVGTYTVAVSGVVELYFEPRW